MITDADGAYSIQAATGEELRFQFLGMKTVIVEVGAGSIYNVQLVEDVEMLDEVTVTALCHPKAREWSPPSKRSTRGSLRFLHPI